MCRGQETGATRLVGLTVSGGRRQARRSPTLFGDRTPAPQVERSAVVARSRARISRRAATIDLSLLPRLLVAALSEQL